MPAAVASSDRSSITAVPSSSGCASGAEGWIQVRPKSASGSVRKKGELTASGCTAEHTSCMKPGIVSSAERRPPPSVSCASRTTVVSPAFASVIAAARPFGPEPTTMASAAMNPPQLE